jgi:transposase
LREHLGQGAEYISVRGVVWTRPRMTVLISRIICVAYDPAHVGQLLTKMGWSGQKPASHASQRNEAIER